MKKNNTVVFLLIKETRDCGATAVGATVAPPLYVEIPNGKFCAIQIHKAFPISSPFLDK